jgi:ABC-type transporter Mla maintaining outer membrane lipid asymmetry ATPase subunit MlaF
MFFNSVLDLLIFKFATKCKLKIYSLTHKKEIRMKTSDGIMMNSKGKVQNEIIHTKKKEKR